MKRAPRHLEPPAAAMPDTLAPMLASPARQAPAGDAWAFEFKWDGVRALCFHRPGRPLLLRSRQGNDVTARYPELHDLAQPLAETPAILDGEIVALDPHSRPSFSVLQKRMHVTDPRRARQLARQTPVVYMLFDLLYLGEQDLTQQSYDQRRGQLEALSLAGPHVQSPPRYLGRGRDVLEAAKRIGLEGVIAKQRQSPYEPGKRSRNWLKLRASLRQEFVVAGWTPSTTHDPRRLGGLLLGYYDNQHRLRFAGKVGTGFDEAAHHQLTDALCQLEQAESPFAEALPHRDARFAQPRLVAEVAFTEWTHHNHVRHPSFQGLRTDKTADEVRKET